MSRARGRRRASTDTPHRGRRVLVPLAVLALLTLAWAGWAAWNATQVRSDLLAASTAATDLRTSLTDGDQASAEQDLTSLTQHATSAADRTDTPTWRIIEHLPGVGDDATAVAVTSSTLADLATNGLEPIVDAAGQLDAGSFTPKDGRLPVDRIAALKAPVTQAGEAFQRAEESLAEVDSSGLLAPVAGPYDDLRDKVATANATLDTAQRAIDVLPVMLGEDGPRTYLLLFQNNAEARATGGLSGAMSLIEVDDGRLEMTKQASSADFGELSEPVLPLTPQERRVFGKNLGTYIQDANFTPDFPRTAELTAARWQREFGHQVDGVLSVDPVALSYLLEATGPITVDGITLTSDNAVQELLNTTYLRLEDPVAQDVFFGEVAKAVFDSVSQGTGDPAALLRALARGAQEHRLLVHDFHADQQGPLDGTAVAGQFPTTADEATDRPQVTVSLNDATGSKMSYYLDYEVDVTATVCQADTQQLTGTLTMVSNAPEDAADLPDYITGAGTYGVDAGTQIVVADIFGPIEGTVSKVKIDGKPSGITPSTYDDRPLAQVPLYFASGDSVALTWSMQTGPGQTGDTDVFVSPGVQPQDESSVVPSACG